LAAIRLRLDDLVSISELENILKETKSASSDSDRSD
jgi:hypothetical protein